MALNYVTTADTHYLCVAEFLVSFIKLTDTLIYNSFGYNDASY